MNLQNIMLLFSHNIARCVTQYCQSSYNILIGTRALTICHCYTYFVDSNWEKVLSVSLIDRPKNFAMINFLQTSANTI